MISSVFIWIAILFIITGLLISNSIGNYFIISSVFILLCSLFSLQMEEEFLHETKTYTANFSKASYTKIVKEPSETFSNPPLNQ